MRGPAYRSVLALAVGLVLIGQGRMAAAETLEEALSKAYRTNPQIRAEQALVRATDELAPQALANWRPTITASAEAGWERLYNNTYTVQDAQRQTRNPKSAKLTINEYLYRGGRTIAATSVAENKILAQRARLMVAEGTVLTETANAYLRVLMQRELLAITSESEQGLASELAGTRRRFDMGERTRTDVSQAETRHAKAVSDRVSAESDLAVAEAMYRGLVGSDAGPVTLPNLPEGLPARRETAIALALEANYGIAAAIYDEKAARESIRLAKGELLPTLALQGTVGRDIESSSNESRVDDATLKLVLSMPIYDGGLAYSKTRQARQTHSQSSINLEKARRDAAEAASKAWDTLTLARDRIRVNEARVTAAETALNNIIREQSFGTRSLIDTLDARQDLLDGRTALIRARHEMYAAAFQLKLAIGEMTAIKLALDEPHYSPKPHYDEVHDKWVGTRSKTDKERGNTVDVPPDPPARPLAPLPSDVAAKAPPPEAKPEQKLPEAKPEQTLPEAKPEQTLPEAKPEQTLPEAKPEQTLPEAKPEQTLPEAKPEQTLPKASAQPVPEATPTPPPPSLSPPPPPPPPASLPPPPAPPAEAVPPAKTLQDEAKPERAEIGLASPASSAAPQGSVQKSAAAEEPQTVKPAVEQIETQPFTQDTLDAETPASPAPRKPAKLEKTSEI